MLKYPVYVRSITNLSDARYCAGMGVEMIGFCFDSQSDDFIEPSIALGIMGWISGVKIVAEFGDDSHEYIVMVAKDLKPDFILIDSSFDNLGGADPNFGDNTDIIYRINLANELKTYPRIGSYILLENSATDLNNYYVNFNKKEMSESYKLILSTGFGKENIDEVQNVYQPYGYSLKGGKEIAPGLKDFDHLAEILEAIEL